MNSTRFSPVAWTVAAHSLFWMVCANGIGLLLAGLLLWPELNGALAPFTYGRWMPLHLNFHLYGWIGIPLVGLLLHCYGLGHDSRVGRGAVSLWSAALAAGGGIWLSGVTSGKLFLDWHGLARWLFIVALTWLWLVLAWAWWRRQDGYEGAGRALRLGLLVLLLPVPAMMYMATSTGIYPSVNPASGGATGASLLGSSLAMAALFLAVPPLLQGLPTGGLRRLAPIWMLWVIHAFLFAALNHGDTSNRDPAQIIGLASLLVWIPLTIGYYRMFQWPRETRIWLYGCAGWGIFLVVDGVIAFLPRFLDQWKFSNALVAHAHLAMAGLVTSFLMLVLLRLAPRFKRLGHPVPALIWHGACFAKVVVLIAAANRETAQPSSLFSADSTMQTIYAIRMTAGVLMFLASCFWLWTLHRPAVTFDLEEAACPA